MALSAEEAVAKLGDRDARVRETAASALRQFAPGDMAPHAGAIVQRLGDSDEDVRNTAILVRLADSCYGLPVALVAELLMGRGCPGCRADELGHVFQGKAEHIVDSPHASSFALRVRGVAFDRPVLPLEHAMELLSKSAALRPLLLAVVSELSRALVLRSAAAAEKSKLPEVANLLQRNETLTAELADARQRITALEAQIADFESLDYVSEDEVREIRPKKKRRVDTQYVKVKRENEEQSAALETARLALGCAICQDVLEAPVSLPCGHAFCFDCIHLHFNSGDVYSRKCPTCRAIMPPCTRRRTFNKNATLNAVVGAITERQNAPGA